MSIEDISKDEKRLNKELEDIEAKTMAHKEAAGEMLKFIITFSELVKMANLYYEYALDTEKHEIFTQVFSELIIEGKKIASFTAKEGFAALFKRHDLNSGSADYIFTELYNIYPLIKTSMEKLSKLSFAKSC
jgi:hypothetical protein